MAAEDYFDNRDEASFDDGDGRGGYDADSYDPYSLGMGTVRRETDKALLVQLVDLGSTTWIPKSCIHDDSEVYDNADNAVGEVIVKLWWAREERL